MKLRTARIIAAIYALALLSDGAAFAQKSEAPASASASPAPSARESAAPSPERPADAESGASRADAESSASQADAGSTASRTEEETGSNALIGARLYRLAEGPLLAAACLVFVAGFCWRIARLRAATRAIAIQPMPPRSRLPRPDQEREDLRFLTRDMSVARRLAFGIRRRLRRTAFASAPGMGLASLLFHIGIFLVPLFQVSHNLLLRRSLGAGLPSLPAPLTDRLTIGILAIGAFFLLRRLFYPRVRALTTASDYLVLLLAAAPFLTGLAAYHRWGDWSTIMAVHMTTADLLIAAIPFTKLGHMPFLIFSRFFVSAERSLRPARRRW